MIKKLAQLSTHAPEVTKVFAFMLALSITTAALGQTNSGKTPPTAGADKIHPAAIRAQPPPKCLQRTPAPTQPGQHTVILTWNPSPSSNAEGYCLYRRKTPHIPKHIEDCKDCEQLNTVPIKVTGCLDEEVPGNGMYYYVATAINGHSDMSEVSNEATPMKKSIPPGSFPSCRQN